jgi:hypothetical protein
MTEYTIKGIVRARDNHCCVECGMTDHEHHQWFGEKIQVHRVSPQSPYTVDGAVTLCEWCHIEKHASYSEDGTVRTTFMLPLALRKAVRIEAMMIGRTMSDIIIRAMEAHPAFMQKVAEVEQFREMLRQRKAAQLEASLPLS